MLKFEDINNLNYDKFDEILTSLTNKHAPLKYKYIRANQGPFMNRELWKSIMTRSRVKHCYLRVKTEEYYTAYKEQRNYCTRLLRTAKKAYYNNLNSTLVNDNKSFWKTVKPTFSDNSHSTESIILIDDNKIISSDIQIANIFNDFFSNAVKNLNVMINPDFLSNCENIANPILKSIKQYNNHPSIIRIKNAHRTPMPFSFNYISLRDMCNEIKKLDT